MSHLQPARSRLSTGSAGRVLPGPPAHGLYRRGGTRGPRGWWALPGSPSHGWGPRTSTHHAAHSLTSCTAGRGTAQVSESREGQNEPLPMSPTQSPSTGRAGVSLVIWRWFRFRQNPWDAAPAVLLQQSRVRAESFSQELYQGPRSQF